MSFHDNLLRFHVVAVDEAHARGHPVGRDVARRVSTDDAPRHVDDLQHAFAIDDDLTVAEEGEGLTGPADGLVCGSKHQLEAALIVRRLGGEGVRRRERLRVFARNEGVGVEQVGIVARQLINKVQVAHFHAFGVDGEGVSAILVGLEVEGHLASCNTLRLGVLSLSFILRRVLPPPNCT